MGIRRFRSTLRVFKDLFDPDQRAALDDELPWYAGVPGEVRDRQVQRAPLRGRGRGPAGRAGDGAGSRADGERSARRATPASGYRHRRRRAAPGPQGPQTVRRRTRHPGDREEGEEVLRVRVAVRTRVAGRRPGAGGRRRTRLVTRPGTSYRV
ncbi:CHAD domain-containing protein [Rhodococcus sp. 4CII]|uniref:CHAD domain-containing protein n=1 Tax=Rhodococcus sp. 4CII TaxID=2834580 RepID=UPI00163B3975|nr:CHAD domain-containing protein [Rhodococcus sp. 3A]